METINSSESFIHVHVHVCILIVCTCAEVDGFLIIEHYFAQYITYPSLSKLLQHFPTQQIKFESENYP